MLIIPEDIHIKHATANYVQYGSDRGLKCEEFPLIIDLNTSADFN